MTEDTIPKFEDYQAKQHGELSPEQVNQAAKNLADLIASRDAERINQGLQYLGQLGVLQNPTVIQAIEMGGQELERTTSAEVAERVMNLKNQVATVARKLLDTDPRIVQLTVGDQRNAETIRKRLQECQHALSVEDGKVDMTSLPTRFQKVSEQLQEIAGFFTRKGTAYMNYSSDPSAQQTFREQIQVAKSFNQIVKESFEEIRPKINEYLSIVSILSAAKRYI